LHALGDKKAPASESVAIEQQKKARTCRRCDLDLAAFFYRTQKEGCAIIFCCAKRLAVLGCVSAMEMQYAQ